MTPIHLVHHFNRTLLNISPRPLGEQEENEFRLSVTQLQEELDELVEAYEARNFIGTIDALIDLEYYLLGVFYKMGVDAEMHDEIFRAVHDCNMLKKAGVNQKRGDHGAVDAIKPAEWIDPEMKIARILENA